MLGITTDCNLIFSGHISAVYKKASSQVGVQMRLHKIIPQLRLYFWVFNLV